MNYQTILTIKESEKATVELAAVELFVGPVIVKRLKGGKPDIYRLLADEKNPHIPQIYAVEEQENELLVAEEYVDGESLGEHLQKNLLSDEQKLNYALQLCEAVGFLHTLKPSVIHRDIKPSNILITGKEELKLIDFDASRQYKEAPSSSDTRLLGTVEYAPPEQFGYSQTDTRSDIYSMGVVFHEMRPTGNKKLAEQWEKIAEKCTSFDPKNRYQSVPELKRELEKLATWKKIRNVRRMAWSGCVVVLLLVAMLITALWSKEERTADTGGAKLTGVPTSEPADAPAEEPTGALTPTMVATETPMPTCTITPTAILTPTNVPLPTSTATPVPAELDEEEQRKIAELVAELNARHCFIDTFYKGLDTGADFMQYSDRYEGAGMAFHNIQMWNLLTEETFLVPKEDFYCTNNVLHIKSDYLRGLEAGCYLLEITYEDRAIGRRGDLSTHLLISEGADVSEKALLFDNDYLEYYYEYEDCIHTILANDIVGSFADTGKYKVLENGRVIEFEKDFLMNYIISEDKHNLRLELKLEDGRTQYIQIGLVPGKPPYMQ